MYNIQIRVPYEKQQYIKKMNHYIGGGGGGGGDGTAADVAAASEAVSCSLGLDDSLTGRLHQRCMQRPL